VNPEQRPTLQSERKTIKVSRHVTLSKPTTSVDQTKSICKRGVPKRWDINSPVDPGSGKVRNQPGLDEWVAERREPVVGLSK